MKFLRKKSGEPKFKEAKAKWSLKDKLRNATVTATAFVMGDTHFAISSAADVVARTEASIVHRLTGLEKHEIRASREKATQMKQDYIKQQVHHMTDTFSRMMNLNDDLVNDINPGGNDVV